MPPIVHFHRLLLELAGNDCTPELMDELSNLVEIGWQTKSTQERKEIMEKAVSEDHLLAYKDAIVNTTPLPEIVAECGPIFRL